MPTPPIPRSAESAPGTLAGSGHLRTIPVHQEIGAGRCGYGHPMVPLRLSQRKAKFHRTQSRRSQVRPKSSTARSRQPGMTAAITPVAQHKKAPGDRHVVTQIDTGGPLRCARSLTRVRGLTYQSELLPAGQGGSAGRNNLLRLWCRVPTRFVLLLR